MRKKYLVMLLFLITIGCNITNVTYHLPNEQELNRYISQNDIQPILIKEYENFSTILEKNGIHTVSANNKGQIKGMVSNWAVNSDNQVSVLSIPSPPTAIIIIQDNEIFKSANKISVIFEDDKRVTQNITDSLGYIIDYPLDTIERINFKKIEFVDQKGNIIFSKKY